MTTTPSGDPMDQSPEPPATPPTGETAEPDAARARPSAARPRTGPIVGGCLLLIFCAVVLQRTFAPGTVDPAVWVTGTVFGLGILLLAVGVAIVLRAARDRRDPPG